MVHSARFRLLLLLALPFLIQAQPSQTTRVVAQAQPPAGAVRLNVVYAPELDAPMQQIIADFNQAYIDGIEPLTGDALTAGTTPVSAAGAARSSGRVMDDVLEYQNTSQLSDPFYGQFSAQPPTIWIPSVSHWLYLADTLSEQPLFTIDPQNSIARTAVVIAIWQSRLEPLAASLGKDPAEVTLVDLLHVAERGWSAYGLAGEFGRNEVFYGRTNPFTSSTGLSMSMLEFYACALDNGIAPAALPEIVTASFDTTAEAALQGCLDDVHAAIVFGDRTTEFVERIAALKTDFVDFVPLSEDDFLRYTAQIRQGTEVDPDADRLLAIYPPEGTFWHDYPFAVPSWVGDEQRAAAEQFRQYLLSRPVQQALLNTGFRPTNPELTLDLPGSPYLSDADSTGVWNEFGVIPVPTSPVFDLPSAQGDQAAVGAGINAVQLDWCQVRQRAYIYLVVDVSQSMLQSDKLGRALEAIDIFLQQVDSHDYVGLIMFSTGVIDGQDLYIPIPSSGILAETQPRFAAAEEYIRSLITQGQGDGSGIFGATALYEGLAQALSELEAVSVGNVTRVAILLSDGDDTLDNGDLAIQVTQDLARLGSSADPIELIPIDYSDTDNTQARDALQQLAALSNTDAVTSNPDDIAQLFSQIGSTFSTSPRCAEAGGA